MITIAIDASTKSTGVAVFKDKQLTRRHNIQDNGKNVLKRIKIMTDAIEEIYIAEKDLNEGHQIQVIM